MRLKVKTHHNLLMQTESISITDIVLNIFIFFFISFSLLYTFSPNKEAKMEMNLPNASSVVKSDTNNKNEIVLNIMKDGRFFLNKNQINPDRLVRELSEIYQSKKDISLIIKADEKVDYGIVINALDKAKLVGIEKLGLATITKK